MIRPCVLLIRPGRSLGVWPTVNERPCAAPTVVDRRSSPRLRVATKGALWKSSRTSGGLLGWLGSRRGAGCACRTSSATLFGPATKSPTWSSPHIGKTQIIEIAMKRIVKVAGLIGASVWITRWYDRLVRQLSGPNSGDERGPATKPPWKRV